MPKIRGDAIGGNYRKECNFDENKKPVDIVRRLKEQIGKQKERNKSNWKIPIQEREVWREIGN